MKKNWKVEFTSFLGRPIPHLHWSPESEPKAGPKAENETQDTSSKQKRILVLGAMHGDEITAVSMVFRWIEILEEKKLPSDVRSQHYMFVPLLNPDGFYANPRTRTNGRGVDLNRNFLTKMWDKVAVHYWKLRAHSDPRRNPGTSAASEPETKLVQTWIDDFRPNLIVSVHAPYRVVDHDGPIDFPKLKCPLPVRTLGAFPGSLGTYAGLERNIPVVTLELPNATYMPGLNDVEDLFRFILTAKFGVSDTTQPKVTSDRSHIQKISKK